MQIYFVSAADYVGIGRKRTNDCADAGWRMRGCNPRERTKKATQGGEGDTGRGHELRERLSFRFLCNIFNYFFPLLLFRYIIRPLTIVHF